MLAREPGGERVACIGALELDLAGRTLRRELIELLRRAQQIGDHGDGLSLGAIRGLLRFWIHRPLRPVIERRMLQHVVIERDLLPAAPLGIATFPLLRDLAPIGAGFLIEGAAEASTEIL